jgi:hypothetical protein
MLLNMHVILNILNFFPHKFSEVMQPVLFVVKR